ncbi:50S ribosomal protein L4 [Candidatus Woesearchaeota archaeon]|nr:50S ribosomal protein L4 [Candidatus Woesearchaeota archaeon]
MQNTMQVTLLSITNQAIGKKALPKQFQETIRPDLVKKACEVIMANTRQPYGAFSEAGKRHSAKLSRRRRDYKTSYGIGISRVPRKIISRRGTRFNWVGAFAPGMVGGRRSHPPKADKQWELKINKKERRKAIRSALAATMMSEVVKRRGHAVPAEYPFIVEAKLEELNKAAQVQEVLEKFGLKKELERASRRKVRAGKGKWRGRKYDTAIGPLLVVSKECPLLAAARNIPGIDAVPVHQLNAALLAPGADVGRLTIFTEPALVRLEQEGLFLQDGRSKKTNAEKPAVPVQQKASKPAAKKAAQKK